MNKTEELRHRAENCAELAQDAKSGPDKKRFERMAEGWQTVAENQAWLDGEDRKDRKDRDAKSKHQLGEIEEPAIGSPFPGWIRASVVAPQRLDRAQLELQAFELHHHVAENRRLFDEFVTGGTFDLGGLCDDTLLRVADFRRELGDELRIDHEKITRPDHDGCKQYQFL